MTPQEILNEIYKLPYSEQTQIAETVLQKEELNSKSNKPTEEEFLELLLEKGLIRSIPRQMTDEEFDFEPIEIEGEPLSEQIIRERR